MKHSLLFIFVISSFLLNAQHNAELYVKGAVLSVQPGALIQVKGDMHNVDAAFLRNDGLIQVQGNLYSSNTFQQRGTGTVLMRNNLVNTAERQFISGSYAVRGGQSQIGVDDGSFYNLELANSQGFVYLVGNGNIADVRNSINFNPLGDPIANNLVTNDIGLTGSFSYPSNGSNYSATFGMMNNAPGISNFINNSVSTGGNLSGMDQGYIIGNLRRSIAASGGIYGFPMGLEPAGSGLSRGLQYSHLNFTTANSYDVVSGYFEQGLDNSFTPMTECSFLMDYFGGVDHGQWVYEDINATVGGDYSISIWPQDDNFSANSAYIVTKDNTISGTPDECGPTPVGLTRSGLSGFSSFGVAAGNTFSLPVELLNIEARAIEDNHILVSWTTTTEINNSGFEIERSTDGITFENINWAEGNGSTTETHFYTIEDYEVRSNIIYYYRLKQIDFDGAFEYSPTVSASLNAKESISMNIYPNPNRSDRELLIDVVSSTKDEASQILIYNPMGQLVFKQDVMVNEGLNHYSIQHLNLASGQYHFVINLSSQQLSTNLQIID